MQQKYVFQSNSLRTFLRGILPFEEQTSKPVFPFQSPDKNFIWRNGVSDNYKVGIAFQQEPLDLSNFLFLRVRERHLLLSKLKATSETVSSGLRFTRTSTEESLKLVNEDISSNLQHLNRFLVVRPEASKLPVAFATNALYVFERNGGASREDYEQVLLPVLRLKGEYLHSEGVAQAVWALANAGIYDRDVWDVLKKAIADKDFGYEYVKNQRWSTENFVTLTGKEHFF